MFTLQHYNTLHRAVRAAVAAAHSDHSERVFEEALTEFDKFVADHTPCATADQVIEGLKLELAEANAKLAGHAAVEASDLGFKAANYDKMEADRNRWHSKFADLEKQRDASQSQLAAATRIIDALRNELAGCRHRIEREAARAEHLTEANILAEFQQLNGRVFKLENPKPEFQKSPPVPEIPTADVLQPARDVFYRHFAGKFDGWGTARELCLRDLSDAGLLVATAPMRKTDAVWSAGEGLANYGLEVLRLTAELDELLTGPRAAGATPRTLAEVVELVRERRMYLLLKPAEPAGFVIVFDELEAIRDHVAMRLTHPFPIEVMIEAIATGLGARVVIRR